jgi:hypothetical protein
LKLHIGILIIVGFIGIFSVLSENDLKYNAKDESTILKDFAFCAKSVF